MIDPAHCEFCGSKTETVDSRASVKGTVRRRRHCTKCDYNYTTREILNSEYQLLLRYRRKFKSLKEYFKRLTV